MNRLVAELFGARHLDDSARKALERAKSWGSVSATMMNACFQLDQPVLVDLWKTVLEELEKASDALRQEYERVRQSGNPHGARHLWAEWHALRTVLGLGREAYRTLTTHQLINPDGLSELRKHLRQTSAQEEE